MKFIAALLASVALAAPAHADGNDAYVGCLRQHGIPVNTGGGFGGLQDEETYVGYLLPSIEQQLHSGVSPDTVVSRLIQMGQTRQKAVTEVMCAIQLTGH